MSTRVHYQTLYSTEIYFTMSKPPYIEGP